MEIEKIQIDTIAKVLKKILSDNTLFSDYILTNKNIQKINTPNKVTEYDFTFVSEKYNRWLFIRVQDFFSHKKLVIFINTLIDKKNVNVDIENYFISELKNKNIKQKLIFKSKSEVELEDHLKNIFKYLHDNLDEQLKGIINGTIWKDMPFDWGSYK